MWKPRTTTRSEVSFRQLCAITRDLRRQAPTIDAVEWKDRIKDRVHQLGFLTPMSERVWQAIAAVEHAHPQERHPPRIRD